MKIEKHQVRTSKWKGIKFSKSLQKSCFFKTHLSDYFRFFQKSLPWKSFDKKLSHYYEIKKNKFQANAVPWDKVNKIYMITFEGHFIWVNMSSQITSLKIILYYQKLSKTISCKTIIEKLHICNRNTHFASIPPVYWFQYNIRYFKSFDKCYGQDYFKPFVHTGLQCQ